MEKKRQLHRKPKKKTVLIIIAIVVVLLFVIIPFSVSIYFYEQVFGIRYETASWQKFSVSEFEGLQRKEYVFKSDKGQKIVGYLYYADNVDYRGVIVFGHGFGGGGHNTYMDCANYFAHNGYYVYAFDATGNDESEGGSVNGLPQQVIDMDYAISYVETLEETKDLPLMLFGHSWGGYTVTNEIKYHPEVKAVVSLAGFNRSSDLLEVQGKYMVGDFIHVLMPYVKAYEWFKFGDYASSTAMDAFESTTTAVLAYHTSTDTIVPAEYGYDIWYNEFADSDRFVFTCFENKGGENGHNLLYLSNEAIDWYLSWNEEINSKFDKWKSTLDYDYESQDNMERFKKEKSEFILENMDREQYCSCIDYNMFNDMLNFYDLHLND